MGELKFRAWVNNHYIYDICVGQATGEVMQNVKPWISELTFELLPEEAVIEQYTGWWDKNKTELGCNDIITEGKRNYLIEYSDEELTWILTNPNMKGYILLSAINPMYFTKIGNIHENPELLKVKEGEI